MGKIVLQHCSVPTGWVKWRKFFLMNERGFLVAFQGSYGLLLKSHPKETPDLLGSSGTCASGLKGNHHISKLPTMVQTSDDWMGIYYLINLIQCSGRASHHILFLPHALLGECESFWKRAGEIEVLQTEHISEKSTTPCTVTPILLRDMKHISPWRINMGEELLGAGNFHKILEWLGVGRNLKDHHSNLLLWTGTPSTRADLWHWTPPRIVCPQLVPEPHQCHWKEFLPNV